MSDDNDKLPALRPVRHDVARADRHAQLPAGSGGRGIVSSFASGLVAAVRAKTELKHRDEAGAIADKYEQQKRAVTNYEELTRQLGRLNDLDNILDDDQADRDHERKNKQRKRENDDLEQDLRRHELLQRLEESGHQGWLTNRRREGEREAADIAAQVARASGQARLEKAQNAALTQQQHREVREAIKNIIVNQERTAQEGEYLDRLTALMDRPPTQLFASAAELDEVIAVLSDEIEAIAAQPPDPAHDALIIALTRVRAIFKARKHE